MFLNTEKGPQSLLSSSRFVSLDELLQGNIEPDARSRFLYDQVAHKSAKLIARFLVGKYARKQFFASLIQKNYRIYRFLKLSREFARERKLAAMKISKYFHQRIWVFRSHVERKSFLWGHVIKIQSGMRRKLAYIKITNLGKGNYVSIVDVLRCWARRCVNRRRKWRGTLRRQHGI